MICLSAFRFFPTFSFLFFRLALACEFFRSSFVLLLLCVVNAHFHDFVAYRHDRVAYEHSLAGAFHDFHESGVVFFTEAHNIAFVADRLRYAVTAAVHFREDDGEQSVAFRAKLAVLCAVVGVAVGCEGFFDVCFFLRKILFQILNRIFVFLAEALRKKIR